MRTPPLFHSKLFWLSLLYLLTTVPFSIYVSFSQSACPLASLPQLRRLHFSYPSSYGVHKYALPTLYPSCNSPVFFPEYPVAVEEINALCSKSSSSSSYSALRYMRGNDAAFAGNFSIEKRKSFFDHQNHRVEVPCGFLKEFPVSRSDKLAMEDCRGVVVVSAIFGDFDKIRQPNGLGSQTLQTVCFFMFIDDATLRGLQIHNVLTDKHAEDATIGVWRILTVQSKKMPYKNDAMNGVIPKHLIHRLFPNSKYSIWVDAKLQLTVDPLLLIHSLLVSKGADMALSKHPFNVHTMQEAMATARWNKWGDVESLRIQMEAYCANGLQPWSPRKLPYTTDVPDTALIIRRHGLATNLFSCLLFNELEAFNPRDQLAFAYVRDLMNPKVKLNMFETQVFEHIAIEYRHNLRREDSELRSQEAQQQNRMASSRDINGSSCNRYLMKMWGES